MRAIIKKLIQIAEEDVEGMKEQRDSARSCGQNDAADGLEEMISEAEATIREAKQALDDR